MHPIHFPSQRPVFSSRQRLPQLVQQGVMFGDPSQRVNDNCGVAALRMMLDAYGIESTSSVLITKLERFLTRSDVRAVLKDIPQRGGLTNVDMMLFFQALGAQPKLADLGRNDNIHRVMGALNQKKPVIILDKDIAEGHFYLILMNQHQLLKYDPSQSSVQPLNRLKINKPGSFALYLEGFPQRARWELL